MKFEGVASIAGLKLGWVVSDFAMLYLKNGARWRLELRWQYAILTADEINVSNGLSTLCPEKSKPLNMFS